MSTTRPTSLRSENAGRGRVLLSLEADLPVRGRHTGTADVVFVVRDMRDGRVVASGTGTMPLPLKPRARAPTGVGACRVHFDVPPGSYMMRTVVREPGGLVGSADRKLDVRGSTGRTSRSATSCWRPPPDPSRYGRGVVH